MGMYAQNGSLRGRHLKGEGQGIFERSAKNERVAGDSRGEGDQCEAHLTTFPRAALKLARAPDFPITLPFLASAT